MTNKSNHPFEPSLQPVFSKQICKTGSENQQGSRHLFYDLIQISEHYDILPAAYLFIDQCLAEAADQHQSFFIDTYHPDEIHLQLNNPVSPLPNDKQNRENLNQCLLASSPVIFTAPCWLQNISQAATSQTETALMLMSVYQKLNHTEQDSSSPVDLFKALLLESGLEIPALHTRAFTQQTQLNDCMLNFAALQLALARYPRTFFPEILGFTLAYCQSQSPIEAFFSIEKLSTLNCSTIFFTVRKCLLDSQISSIIAAIESYLRLFPERTDRLWQRIQKGFRLYQHQIELCNLELKLQLLTSPSPQQALAQLLIQKAAFAYGHHSKIQLAGKTLDEWFAQSPFDSENFLTALNQSSYINRQKPADSQLLKLFDFNGPMFGVFSPSEKKILETWLISGKEATQSPNKLSAISTKLLPEAPTAPFPESLKISSTDYSRLTNRELYYYLLNVELFPDAFTAAKQKVQNVLRTARFFNRLPFRPYDHQAFDDYIHTLYQQEIKSYQPLKKIPALSKKAYLWGIEQLAPAILTDGCWLQSISQLDYLPNRAIGNILFRTYCDELGNGVLQQNHPHIYRQLLESQNIRLPPTHTREFSGHIGFIDSAFDLPVYLLSISHFPGSFLPEILGLNMAIELSGLGKVYLRLAEELKFWDIDPTIVNLHLSIDNFSTGHSAMAKDAIQLYLDEISACYGENEMQRHWHRIYAGYCSLHSASRQFKFLLVYRYFIKKAASFLKKENNDSKKSFTKLPLKK